MNANLTPDIVADKTHDKNLSSVALDGEGWTSKNIPAAVVEYVNNRLQAEVLPIYQQRQQETDPLTIRNLVYSMRDACAQIKIDASKLWQAL